MDMQCASRSCAEFQCRTEGHQQESAGQWRYLSSNSTFTVEVMSWCMFVILDALKLLQIKKHVLVRSTRVHFLSMSYDWCIKHHLLTLIKPFITIYRPFCASLKTATIIVRLCSFLKEKHIKLFRLTKTKTNYFYNNKGIKIDASNNLGSDI